VRGESRCLRALRSRRSASTDCFDRLVCQPADRRIRYRHGHASLLGGRALGAFGDLAGAGGLCAERGVDRACGDVPGDCGRCLPFQGGLAVGAERDACGAGGGADDFLLRVAGLSLNTARTQADR